MRCCILPGRQGTHVHCCGRIVGRWDDAIDEINSRILKHILVHRHVAEHGIRFPAGFPEARIVADPKGNQAVGRRGRIERLAGCEGRIFAVDPVEAEPLGGHIGMTAEAVLVRQRMADLAVHGTQVRRGMQGYAVKRCAAVAVDALGCGRYIEAIALVEQRMADSVHFIAALTDITMTVHAGQTRRLVHVGNQLERAAPGAVCRKDDLIAGEQGIVQAVILVLDPGSVAGGAVVVHGGGLVEAVAADQSAAGGGRNGDVTLAAGSGRGCAGTYGGVAFGALLLKTRGRGGIAHVEAALHEDGVVAAQVGMQAGGRAGDDGGMAGAARFCRSGGDKTGRMGRCTGIGGNFAAMAAGAVASGMDAVIGEDGRILLYGTVEDPEFF